MPSTVKISHSRLENFKIERMIKWLWITSTFVVMVSTQDNFYANGRFGKRKEKELMLTLPLVLNRFSRSDISKNPKLMSQLIELVPRMERFFTGSRYGKRSLGPLSTTTAMSARRLADFNSGLESAIDYVSRIRPSTDFEARGRDYNDITDDPGSGDKKLGHDSRHRSVYKSRGTI
ncbi:hypothetical protein QAD02_016064 [Eretmocerus hayati]|uniref:Uncharacterized protein n=1 Tax=Eretmocerus hayati TaxID=131215 RepID=A0ACC2PCX7_9HYME|nr:hypothetical protein QAD02_016064 [Eretmocerus hayati]